MPMVTNKGEGSEKESDSSPRPARKRGPADARSEKIRIPEVVWRGLEAVRQSGLTNMLDRPAVAKIAEEFGFSETAYWVANNRKEYAVGIFKGFEVEYDSREL